MSKRYGYLFILLASLLLVACATKEPVVEEVKGVKEEIPKSKEVEFLTDEEIKEIVINNLDLMEERVLEDFDEMLMPEVDETILVPGESEGKIEDLVDTTREKFEDLVSHETIDDWVRLYLYDVYSSLHGVFLSSYAIQTRFEVLNQSEDHFEVRFLELMVEPSPMYSSGTYHLHYVKENDVWVFQSYDFSSPEDKPFNLTFKDLEEYYSEYDEVNDEGIEKNFEAIETVEIDDGTYLIYKIYGEYNAVNANNSEINYDLVESYTAMNESSDPIEEVEKNTHSKTNADADLSANSIGEKLDPSDYTQYLGKWTNSVDGDMPNDFLTLTEQDGQVEVWYTVIFSGSRTNDMVGVTTFGADGSATYEYETNYFGESGTVHIQLREDGIEVGEFETTTLFTEKIED